MPSSQDSSKIAALSPSFMKDKKFYCGKYIQATNTGGGQGNTGKGKTVVVKVQDTCPECEQGHLDLSHGAFQAMTGGKLDPPGKINISWKFVAKASAGSGYEGEGGEWFADDDAGEKEAEGGWSWDL